MIAAGILAAVGCVRESKVFPDVPRESDASQRTAPAGASGERAGAGTGVGVDAGTPMAGRNAPRDVPPAAQRPTPSDAGPGPCNGGVLVRQGSGYICDCTSAAKGGPFCDGIDEHAEDAGVDVPEQPSERALSISADSYTTCALMESHTVRCWGQNGFGNLGDGTRTDSATPVRVKELNRVTQLDLGLTHACAVIEDGTLRCWGNNDSGMLRDGSDNDRNIPVTAQGLENVVQVSLGESQSCVRHRDDTLECWLPVMREGLLDANGTGGVVDVEAGYFITTAWFADGSVRSWGEHKLPATAADQRIVRVSSGYGFVCAVLEDGAVLCSGWNHAGQLGTGSAQTEGDGKVAGLSGVVDIAAGFEHACALLEDHTLRCWGQNERGQLGDGSFDDRRAPSAVSGLEHVAEVACGREHCCARTDDGRVSCWGNNESGQLGDGTKTDRSAPVSVRGL